MAGLYHTTHGQTATSAAIKESVVDVIFQITPEDTPFFDSIGNSTAISPVHSWSTRDLSTRSPTPVQDAASHTAEAAKIPSIVTNLTTILKKVPQVGGSQQASSYHGISDLMADQIDAALTEHKTDIENYLMTGSLVSGASGGAGTVRQGNGFRNVVSDNALDYHTSPNVGSSVTEEIFNSLFQAIWTDGGKPTETLMNGTSKMRTRNFNGSGTKFFMQDDKRVVATIDVYEGPFAVTNIRLSRDVPDSDAEREIWSYDPAFFAKAWLRPTAIRPLAYTADADAMVIISEFALEYGNEKAAGLLTGME